MSLNDDLFLQLAKRKEKGLLRQLKSTSLAIDFYSNDYLGLARSNELFEAIRRKQSKDTNLNGATGSRLLSGNSQYHEEVENKLAKIFQSESTLLFNSGYTANLAVLSAIAQKNDTILYDELSHACIKDGARLNHATRHPFRHNDLEDLETKIRKSTGRIFIAVESVYSMDGDQCPLEELVDLADRYQATIILDEAHSTGAYGLSGSGLATERGVADKIAIRIYTFGKAMGIHGACVAGSNLLKQFLINFARPFIYTTAPDHHTLASIESAFEFLSGNMSLQNQLQEKVKRYVENTKDLTNCTTSNTAIQTAFFPGNQRAVDAAKILQGKGFDVRPVLSPTVPAQKERLRICLHAYNSAAEIDSLVTALKDLQLNNE